MATHVLRLDSSVFGEQGASTRLNGALVEALRQRHGDLQVTRRDLAADPLPHVGADVLTALATAAQRRSPDQQRMVELADSLILEVRRADVLVIAAPMYNFGIPSTLKTWMAYIARAGETFHYTADGPVGHLQGKKVYVVSSRGGLHRDQPSDGVVPLLRAFFHLLGITDLDLIYAEGLNLGEVERQRGLAAANAQIARLAA